MNYKRDCLKCGQEIIYKTKSAFDSAERKKTTCKTCRIGKDIYFRNCPQCNTVMGYTKLTYYKQAVKNHLCCRSCKNTPKERKCIDCNSTFLNKTGGKTRCDQCQEKYRISLIGTRNCPQCSKEITYKTIGDLRLANKNNACCKSCSNKKTSVKRKGKTSYDIWIEKGMSIKEAKFKWQDQEERRIKSREGYRHSEETLRKIVQRRKQNNSYSHSEETRKKMSINQKKRVSAPGYKIFNNVKRFNVLGLLCQGTFEQTYIQNLHNTSQVLPVNAEQVKTNDGIYFPDFEYSDRYVEIKSTFTYKLFTNRHTNQIDKVIWTGQNVKPVQLLVLDINGKILKEEWYTKDGVEVKINLL